MDCFKSTKELYEELLEMHDLHSVPELHDSLLIWHLYKDAHIIVSTDKYDASIDIIGNSPRTGSLMHWHPDPNELLQDLHTLGKKGNILVLKKTLLATEIFYMGAAEDYPVADHPRLHFGRKKWSGGMLTYLEQK